MNLYKRLFDGAKRHGRSMEEEARLILSQAAEAQEPLTTAAGQGLGSRMTALFAGLGLEESIPQWQRQEAETPDFGP